MRWALGLGGLGLVYLLAWPVAMQPEPWQPGESPGRTGDFAVNDVLTHAASLELGAPFSGPEDIAIDGLGRVYASTEQGAVLRWQPDGQGPEVFASTEGRPLGLDIGPDGSLWVADAVRGLLQVDASGTVRAVATALPDRDLVFVDDVEVGPDGTVWFSEASDTHHFEAWQDDVLETAPRGSLLRYDVDADRVEVVLDGLYFANGVAVDPRGQYVLVNETSRYRVRRVWVAGPRAGQDEVWLDNLPGYPDGISRGEDGLFWLCVVSSRQDFADALAPRPWLRKVVARLPRIKPPAAMGEAMVLGLDADGRVVHNLQDTTGFFGWSTSAQQHGDVLYVGSLIGTRFLRHSL
jgi:sugar lactone lactonase YvrE